MRLSEGEARAHLAAHDRAEVRRQNGNAVREAALAARLAEGYPQYHDQPFDRVLLLRIVGVTGWAASAR
jgi:hypothetical protein